LLFAALLHLWRWLFLLLCYLAVYLWLLYLCRIISCCADLWHRDEISSIIRFVAVLLAAY
jgi:hypothetical protein